MSKKSLTLIFIILLIISFGIFIFNNTHLEKDFVENTETFDGKEGYISESGDIYTYTIIEGYIRQEITLTNQSSGAEFILPLSEHIRDISDVNFIRNRIAVRGHVNPSLEILGIFSLETGEMIIQKHGYGFTFADNNELYYVKAGSPHFSGLYGNDKIMNENDDILYESEVNITILAELVITEDSIEFHERDEATSERSVPNSISR